MSECKQKKMGLVVILILALGVLAPMLHLEHGTLAMNHLIAPVLFAFWGFWVLTGCYGRKNLYAWLGIAMIGWFYVSRVILGEPLLDESYSRLCGLCAAYLLALPFAGVMRDHVRKRGLLAVAVCYVAVMGVLGWLSIYAAFIGEIVTLPYLDTHIHISYGRLWMNTHPNTSACMLLIAFMLGVWLITRVRSRVVHGLILAALAGMYLGIALTVSRTSMIQLACFVGGIIALGVLHLSIKTKWKRIALAVPAAAVCAVLVFLSFSLAVDGINSMHALAESPKLIMERGFLDNLPTLTGRTGVYERAIQMLTTQPRLLLFGVLDSEWMEVIRPGIEDVHAHNSFLQTVLNYGLPALLLALALVFCALRSSLKLILNDKAAFSDQLLAGTLLVLLIGTITEPYLFTDNLTICNFAFMLVLGYVIETERHTGKS